MAAREEESTDMQSTARIQNREAVERHPDSPARGEPGRGNGQVVDGVDSQAKAVEVTGLNLFYGDFHAVRDVNVTIQPNRVTALIGSSGCGKSTFLRSINRMHELVVGARVEGEVVLEGQDI